MIPGHTLPSSFSTIQFTVILISTFRCSKWFPSLRLSNQNPLGIPLLHAHRVSLIPSSLIRSTGGKSPSSSIWNFLQVPDISSPLAQICSSAPCSLFWVHHLTVPSIARIIWRQKQTCEWIWCIGGLTLRGKTWVLGGETAPVPLFTPKIPHGQAWDWILASALRGRQMIDSWRDDVPSRKPSTYVLHLPCHTKLHIHTKQQAESQFCIIWSLRS